MICILLVFISGCATIDENKQAPTTLLETTLTTTTLSEVVVTSTTLGQSVSSISAEMPVCVDDYNSQIKSEFNDVGLGIGRFINITANDSFRKMLVKIWYNESVLRVPEDTLMLYRFDEKTKEWVKEPYSRVDTQQKLVIGEVKEEGVFTAFGEPRQNLNLTVLPHDAKVKVGDIIPLIVEVGNSGKITSAPAFVQVIVLSDRQGYGQKILANISICPLKPNSIIRLAKLITPDNPGNYVVIAELVNIGKIQEADLDDNIARTTIEVE